MHAPPLRAAVPVSPGEALRLGARQPRRCRVHPSAGRRVRASTLLGGHWPSFLCHPGTVFAQSAAPRTVFAVCSSLRGLVRCHRSNTGVPTPATMHEGRCANRELIVRVMRVA
jgi:hypothetical protein